MATKLPASNKLTSVISTNEETATFSQIIEALLFSSPQSLTVQQITKITGEKKIRKIRSAIDELNAFYIAHDRAYFIQNVAGGYQIRTDARFHKWIKKGRIIKPLQLSQPVMETLSIVAYQQPITRAEIEEIRSVDATYTLRTLLDKKLVKIVGKKDVAGRPLLYGTTRFFLELFGFKSLSDLPNPEDADIISDTDTV